MIAIFTAVFDDALPGFSGLYGFPKICKRFLRHIRVANDVVSFAQQFILAIAGNIEEIAVGGGNTAADIRGCNQVEMVGVVFLFLCDRSSASHGCPILWGVFLSLWAGNGMCGIRILQNINGSVL